MRLIRLTLFTNGNSYWINPRMLSGIMRNSNGTVTVYMVGEAADDFVIVNQSVDEILWKLEEIE